MPRLSRPSRAVPFLAAIAVTLILLSITESRARAQALTTTVTLIWTATGDDGLVGRATRYDFRYSAKTLSGRDTTTWWSTASAVHTAAPSTPGARDSLRLAGLVIGLKYYAILRVGDEAGNWSGFSNVAAIDLSRGVTATESLDVAAAPKLTVGAPYPSPTRGKAQISLTLARSGGLQADVYDARGRRVRSLYSGSMEAGSHVLRWDGDADTGGRAAAGVYWVRVASQEAQKTVKIVVVH